MLLTINDNKAERDIGQCSACDQSLHVEKLKNAMQHTLHEMQKVLGTKQVSRKRMEFVPPLIIKRAKKGELKRIWKEAYVKVAESSFENFEIVIKFRFV